MAVFRRESQAVVNMCNFSCAKMVVLLQDKYLALRFCFAEYFIEEGRMNIFPDLFF